MKWPFMSVRVHERIRDSYHNDLNAALGQQEWAEKRADRAVAVERARFDALLDKYHALKLNGASVPEPKPSLAPAQRPQSESQQAIEDVVAKFGGSIKLRRRLTKYRDDMLAADSTESEVAHAIRHWRDPDSDEDAA